MDTLRVLLVDDQPSILMLVRALLEHTLPAVDVRTAGSAQDALAILCRESYDVVLSDVSMPGGTGFFLLAEARRRWPSLRVVLMSGAPVAGEAQAAGADAFLSKPFTAEQVHAALSLLPAGCAPL
jgi:CheY-like chemotaxis protein